MVAIFAEFFEDAVHSVGLLVGHIYFWWISLIYRLVNIFFAKRVVPPPHDDLLLITAGDAAAMIRARELTSLELVEAYIQRITDINAMINAVAEHNFDEARRRARQVDAMLDGLDPNQIHSLAETKPLLGIPFTIKDCIEVAGMHCTIGLTCRKDVIAKQDSIVVDRMKNAGAIHLAMTNVSEVCMWWESVNAVHGRSRNAYDGRRIVGGSSGGEGALISAAGSLVGIGSDIGGSIRMPAFFNGVFGLKPTPGIVPLKGHMPAVEGYREQMLCIGPICRYATDLGLMMKVLGGMEAENVLQLEKPVDMRTVRLFYMEGMQAGIVQPMMADMRKALRKIKYDLVAVRLDLPLVNQGMEMWFSSMEHKGAAPFSQHLCDLKGDLNLPIEFARFLVGKSQHNLISLIIAALDNHHPFGEEHTRLLLSQRDRLIREVRELLGDDGILFFPSFPTVAPFHTYSNVAPANKAYMNVWNTLLVPVVQCPMGLDANGIPLGVQAIATPGCDRLLIAVAKHLEDGFGGWKPSGVP